MAALLVHLLLAWWLMQLPVPRPEFRSIPVTLVPDIAVEDAPVIPKPAPTPRPVEAEPQPPAAPDASPSKPAPPVPDVRERPMELPGPSATDLLSRMSRYRLDGESQLVLPPPQPRIRLLGEPPPGDLLAELAPQLPELPFADTEMDVEFYPMGVRGDVHRMVDAVTPEFGFKTKSGIEVRCRFLLVMLSCGWREL